MKDERPVGIMEKTILGFWRFPYHTIPLSWREAVGALQNAAKGQVNTTRAQADTKSS